MNETVCFLGGVNIRGLVILVVLFEMIFACALMPDTPATSPHDNVNIKHHRTVCRGSRKWHDLKKQKTSCCVRRSA